MMIMEYYRGGCHYTLIVLFITLVLHLLFLFSFSVHGSVADDDSSLLELLSRDEAVQMAGYGEEKLSTVLITGSLLCHDHPHFHNNINIDQPQPQSHACPISGARIGVNCHSHAGEMKGNSTVAEGVTDEFGDFMVDLPSHLHAIPNLEKICTVKLLRIPKGSLCRPGQIKKHKGLRLSSFGNGIRTYTAGNIRIWHSTSHPLLHTPRIHGGN